MLPRLDDLHREQQRIVGDARAKAAEDAGGRGRRSAAEGDDWETPGVEQRKEL